LASKESNLECSNPSPADESLSESKTARQREVAYPGLRRAEIKQSDGKQEDSLVRRLLLVAVSAFAFPWSAFAQESTPKAEVFGGYSYFRATDPTTIHLNGWNGSITGNLTDWFGVVGDFSGHYGSPSIFGIGIPFVDVQQHSFLFGPRLSYRGNDKVTPFGHFLIGVSRANAGAFGLSLSDTALAAAAGGGLDINLNDTVAIRAVQADYLMTRFQDERQDNLRLSFGIVFRFGR
jgi:opacity protein-like surface antigen